MIDLLGFLHCENKKQKFLMNNIYSKNEWKNKFFIFLDNHTKQKIVFFLYKIFFFNYVNSLAC